jgi:hypothetical protein
MKDIDKRIGELEIQAEPSRRKMEREARIQWRKDNSQRLRWEMFLRVWGPDSDWYGTPGEDEPDEIRAYRSMLKRVLKHYNGQPDLFEESAFDYDKMRHDEKAFAYVFNGRFIDIEDHKLMDCDIHNQCGRLGINDNPHVNPLSELIKVIDTDMGGSDWRQICYTEEQQQELDESFGIHSDGSFRCDQIPNDIE